MIKSPINNTCFLYNFIESKVIAKISWNIYKKKLITLKFVKKQIKPVRSTKITKLVRNNSNIFF